MSENQELGVVADLAPQAPVETVAASEVNAEQAAEQQQEQQVQEAPKPQIPNAVHKRIGELTAARREAERQAESERNQRLMVEAELQRLRGSEGEKPQQHGGPSQEEIRAEAVRLVAQQQFDDRCNAVWDQGVKEEPGFADAVRNLQSIGGMPRDFLEAVTELPNATQVIAHLGNDLDAAQRISGLSGARLGLELAKISSSVVRAVPPASRAPAPTQPINGAGRQVTVDPDDMSMTQFKRWREEFNSSAT